jgi:hypothetical protein
MVAVAVSVGVNVTVKVLVRVGGTKGVYVADGVQVIVDVGVMLGVPDTIGEGVEESTGNNVVASVITGMVWVAVGVVTRRATWLARSRMKPTQ